MSQYLDALKERLAQLSDIGHAASLAHWDQQTMMPPAGSGHRAEQMATLSRAVHEHLIRPAGQRQRRGGKPEEAMGGPMLGLLSGGFIQSARMCVDALSHRGAPRRRRGTEPPPAAGPATAGTRAMNEDS